MKKFTVKTLYATYEDCYFRTGKYVQDGSLYIGIWNDEDGPIADITRCLGDASGDNAYLDMNNCPWSADLVKELEIGKPTGKYQQSGFCIYPLYNFNFNKIMEYGKEMDE